MLRLGIVAAASFLFGGALVWALGPADPDEEEERTEEAAGDRGARRRTEEGRVVRDSPGTLAACKQSLVKTQLELRTAQTTAARAVAGRLFDDDEGLPSGEAASRPTDAAEAAETQAREQTMSKVRDALVEHLQITDAEEHALTEFVCTQRENVRGLFDQFAQGSIDADALFQAIRAERNVSADGLKTALGAKRYRRLRRLGATSMLAGRLCKTP